MREDLEAIAQAIPELAKAEFQEPERKHRVYGKKHIGKIGGGIIYPAYDDLIKVIAQAGEIALEIEEYRKQPARVEAAGIERPKGHAAYRFKAAIHYKGQEIDAFEEPELRQKIEEGRKLVQEAYERPVKPEEKAVLVMKEKYVEE